MLASDRAAGQKGGEDSNGGERHSRTVMTVRVGTCVDSVDNVATRFAASVMGSAACESGNGDAGCLPQVVRIITAHSWEITSAQGSASLFTLLQKCGSAGCSRGRINVSGRLWGVL